MHLQFVGLPASGKSTIVDSLVKKYPSKFVRGEKRYTSITKLVFLNPGLFLNAIWSARSILWLSVRSVQESKVSIKNKVLAILGLLLNLSNYRYSLTSSNSKGHVTIWDELVLQRTLSIFAYSDKLPSEKDVIKFVQWSLIHCSALPILVNIENEVQMIRLFKRGVPHRMKSLEVSTIEKINSVQYRTLQLLKNQLITYQVIDSSLDINENLNKIIIFTK